MELLWHLIGVLFWQFNSELINDKIPRMLTLLIIALLEMKCSLTHWREQINKTSWGVDLEHDEELREGGVAAVLPAEAAGEAGPGVPVLGLHVLHQAPASRVQAPIQIRVMETKQSLSWCCMKLILSSMLCIKSCVSCYTDHPELCEVVDWQQQELPLPGVEVGELGHGAEQQGSMVLA